MPSLFCSSGERVGHGGHMANKHSLCPPETQDPVEGTNIRNRLLTGIGKGDGA